MAESLNLDLIGTTVLETREMRCERARRAAGGESGSMQDDQTVMIRMLQAREAEIDLMRSLEQHYAGLRARMVEFEQRLAKLEAAQ